MKEVLLVVRGRVQGVGYRWFVKSIADKMGIKGYVMNLSNGDVEVVAQGDNEDLKTFINKIKIKDNYGAYVNEVLILREKKSFTPYEGFFIRRE